MRTKLLLLATVALTGCQHHSLACFMSVPYADCPGWTDGAVAYAHGERFEPMDPYAAGLIINGINNTPFPTTHYQVQPVPGASIPVRIVH